MRIELSLDTDTILLPSLLKLTEFTTWVCPSNIRTHSHVTVFHMRIVLPQETVTNRLSSALNTPNLKKPKKSSITSRYSPVWTSHMRIVSDVIDAILLPSLLKVTQYTPAPCTSIMRIHSPVAVSQMRTDSSKDTDSSLLQSVEKLIELIAWGPSNIRIHSHVVVSHMRIVASDDAVAIILLSALNTTELTCSSCPFRVWRHSPVKAFQIRTV